MTPQRHARAKDVFLAALGVSPDQREALLIRECSGDAPLLDEVRGLLAAHVSETVESTPPTGVTGRRNYPPGTVIAQRYRIIARLGAGGMGEVYRADDITLQQPVALKFLPHESSRDPRWVARFRNEARLARTVTHANVCRIHDLCESDGEFFLSMEYVDGEDLASLLRRIGRLPAAKAVDVSRQICLGLAVAHHAGVLHRDLKPANIMLDGQGVVRITDFGIAAVANEVSPLDIRTGTAAYMAPEQITGREVTQRSDVYALGLVMFETFTGRQAFQADAVAEYVELHQHEPPPRPSELAPDIPHEVEGIITHCLCKDPAGRPASALLVAAALPGSDVLRVAVASNLTPSPELVAAARLTGPRIRPGTLVAASLALLVATVVSRSLYTRPWDDLGAIAPTVLAERARILLGDQPSGSARTWDAYGYCDWAEAFRVFGPAVRDPGLTPAGKRPVFWYRQSLEPLDPTGIQTVMFGSGRATISDPSPFSPGMSTIVMDLSGEPLLSFPATGASPVNDGRGTAATSGARTVFDRSRTDLVEGSLRTLFLVMTAIAVPVAWRGHRRGKLDRDGGLRLALFVLVADLTVTVLRLGNVSMTGILPRLPIHVLRAFGIATLLGAFYVVVDMYARRFWPDVLVTWNRAIQRRLRDSDVRMHVALGVAAGCCWTLLKEAEHGLVHAMGWQALSGVNSDRIAEKVYGARDALASCLVGIPQAIAYGLLLLLMAVVARMIVRNPRVATGATAIVLAAILWLRGAHPATSWLFLGIGGAALCLWVLTRVGLLSLVVAMFVSGVLNATPIDLRKAGWYTDLSVFSLALVAALAGYGLSGVWKPQAQR